MFTATALMPDQLTSAMRRRGLVALLVSTFFAWGGFFLVIPLIAVHYVDQLGWTAASVGLVLAVRQFAQQGLTTICGVVSDRLGPKPLICAGMLIRSAGFAAMAFADSYPRLMVSAVLAAVGGALFESPKAAAIAALTEPATRPRFFALAGVVSGLGITLGTQAGALLIRADFAAVALAGAACYVVIFLVVALLLPPVRVASAEATLGGGLGLALRDRTFLLFLALLAGYWFAWTQFSLTLTLAATEIAGTESAVAWIYGVNAAVTVGLGYLLPRLLERRLTPVAMLTAGTAVTAVGLGLALRDRTFLLFLTLLAGYWFAWTQFSLTLTLAATEIAGTESA
ncbi:MAG: MFS transporter, partial [Chloroflexota bacterium]|nr:MFS transporter [Chloroflexota bacterium]